MATLPAIRPVNWSANDLQHAGCIIKDAYWLFDVYTQSKGKSGNDAFVERFGILDQLPDPVHLDYAIHRAFSVPLMERDSVHETNKIYVIVHCNREKVWKITEDRPTTYIAYRNGKEWRMIPIV